MKTPGFPIIRWPGGKTKVARQLLSFAPKAWMREYREPFFGSGAVYGAFWNWYQQTGLRPPKWWVNDGWEPLARMYQSLRDVPEFAERLIEMRASVMPEEEHEDDIRRLFDDCRFEFAEFEDPAALWFLTRYAFDQYVGLHRLDIASFNADYLRDGVRQVPPERIYGARTMLQDATITCQDFETVITAPGERVFLLLDPPYYQGTKEHGSPLYAKTFTYNDHVRLFDLLAETPHRFLMTHGWSPFVRRMARERGFHLIEQEYRYSRGKDTKVKRPGRGQSKRPWEYIITNYDIADKSVLTSAEQRPPKIFCA